MATKFVREGMYSLWAGWPCVLCRHVRAESSELSGKTAATGSCVFLIAEGKEGYHEALERCRYENHKLLQSFRKEAGCVEHGSPDLTVD